MSLMIPNTAQTYILNLLLNQNLKLKLFSNDVTPTITDTLASFTEVSGGGYAEITLVFADWVVTEGPPAVGVYDSFQDFDFTGATSGPGTIWGYMITNNAEDLLYWVERFPISAALEPINGSQIRIKPRITLDNAA